MVIIGDAAHPMLPHQGQGGAQGIEDGIALGISLCGVESTADVNQRLVVFEKVRRHRASAIQIMSNAGADQVDMIHQQVAKYIDHVPKTHQEFAHFNWGCDIVQRTVDLVREMIDPTFALPCGFFEGDPYMPCPPPRKPDV